MCYAILHCTHDCVFLGLLLMPHYFLIHLFVSGVSIASWLPSFSVELHEDGHRTDSTNAANWNGSDAAALHQTVSLSVPGNHHVCIWQ